MRKQSSLYTQWVPKDQSLLHVKTVFTVQSMGTEGPKPSSCENSLHCTLNGYWRTKAFFMWKQSLLYTQWVPKDQSLLYVKTVFTVQSMGTEGPKPSSCENSLHCTLNGYWRTKAFFMWKQSLLYNQWVPKDQSLLHSKTVFPAHLMDNEGSKLSSCGQRWLWSDWAEAQADLSLCWGHTHIDDFLMSWLI